jgi:nucleosome binding factor SPN SPT16 subunit
LIIYVLSSVDLSLSSHSQVVEGAYGAIVQSGGHYNLALYANNTAHKLAFDTIICSIGTKYKVG